MTRAQVTGTDDAGARDIRRRVYGAIGSWASLTGLRKLSMDEVAARASVGRATLYKYFPGKDALIKAFVRHELDKFFAGTRAVVERYDDEDDRIVHGFAHAYRELRDHPAVGPVLRLNPDMMVPYVITDDSFALNLGREFIEDVTMETSDLPAEAVAQFAEFFARAFHTLILIPPVTLALNEPGGAEAYARNFIVPVKNHLADAARQKIDTGAGPHERRCGVPRADVSLDKPSSRNVDDE